jgi:fibrillarin-like pre-rRNA processing protein
MTALLRTLWKEGKLYTLDREGGRSVYGEKIIEVNGSFYREWIPWRSKLSALMKKLEKEVSIAGDILYLGAAQGTTVSHISDILESGTIFAVEFSNTAYRKLVLLAKRRDNIVPIMEDAFHPERFRAMVSPVDILYQDVSQKEQLKLFVMNSKLFLKKGGMGFLMLKSRSVDVTARPNEIYEKVVEGLRSEGLKVEEIVELDPFQVDHAAILISKK